MTQPDTQARKHWQFFTADRTASVSYFYSTPVTYAQVADAETRSGMVWLGPMENTSTEPT